MQLSNKASTKSKLVPPRNGKRPCIEKTEGEKIRIATNFLQRRGYFVLQGLVTRDEVAALIGCSLNHLENLRKNSEFPKPFDISSNRSHINHKRQMPRWHLNDIIAWLEDTISEEANNV